MNLWICTIYWCVLLKEVGRCKNVLLDTWNTYLWNQILEIPIYENKSILKHLQLKKDSGVLVGGGLRVCKPWVKITLAIITAGLNMFGCFGFF